jgi:hypothetical protein
MGDGRRGVWWLRPSSEWRRIKSEWLQRETRNLTLGSSQLSRQRGGSKDPRPRLTRLLEGGNALDLLRAARSAYVLAYGWWPGDELDELKDRVAQIRRAWDLMLPPE